MQFTDQTLRMQ